MFILLRAASSLTDMSGTGEFREPLQVKKPYLPPVDRNQPVLLHLSYRPCQ